MFICSENHPSIISECEECPMCIVLDELWAEPKLKARLKVKLEELERPALERAERELAELRKQQKASELFTKENLNEMFKNQPIGQFEPPFAGEYKEPKLTIEKQGGTNE